MYKALSKLFAINTLSQISSLRNEIRTMKMTKEDIVASLFVRIAIIIDELHAIDEILLEKDLVITTLLGLPTYWCAFSSSINSWKENLTFKQLWNACSQEEVRISLVGNEENKEEKFSNAYFAHYKKKETFKKCEGPRSKVDLSKIECYNCHKMGHYRSNCPKNLRNKKREREHANVVDEGPPKKNKME